MSTWPQNLPPIRLPVEFEHQDSTIRTQMESGPAKIRQRFTATSMFYSLSMRMTGAEYATLDTFYGNNKATSFDMDDPTSGQTESFRFTAPPQASVIAGEADADKRLLDVHIQLERLP